MPGGQRLTEGKRPLHQAGVPRIAEFPFDAAYKLMATSRNHPGKGDDTPEPLAQDLGTGSNRAGPDGGHASLPAA